MVGSIFLKKTTTDAILFCPWLDRLESEPRATQVPDVHSAPSGRAAPSPPGSIYASDIARLA